MPLHSEHNLTFTDAIRIARGCLDYGGGHHNDGQLEAFHHGIQTVINSLEAAAKNGLSDFQVLSLWRIGNSQQENNHG